MFDNITIGDYLTGVVRNGLMQFISGTFANLYDAIHAFISIALILSIVIYGVRFMAGDIQGTLKNLLITCGGVLFAIGITEPDFYYEFIAQPLYGVRDNMFSFISAGKVTGSVFEMVSSTFSRIFLHADIVIGTGSMTNVSPILAGIAIYLIYGAYYVLLVGVTVLCEFATGILLCLGVIVLPFSAFLCGRGLAKAWCKAIAKYTFTFIVIAVVVSLLNEVTMRLVAELLVESYNESINDGGTPSGGRSSPILGATLIVGIFGGLLMLKASEIAAEVTGGVMSDGAAGITAVTSTANMAINGMKAAKGFGGSGINALRNKFGG